MASDFTPPLSLWIQLASFFFLLSGLHGDLLVIRFFLVLAYVMLLVNAVLGSPLWPELAVEGLGLDSLIWAVLSMYVHGSSLLSLIIDERPVNLGEDEAALWRMMYRTGGLSARLFQSIVACHLNVIEVEEGRFLPTDDHFYIIYRGQIELNVMENNSPIVTRTVVSGEAFDLDTLDMFTEDSIFRKNPIRCVTITPAKLFQIHKNDIKNMAHHELAKGVWQAILINNLSYVVESNSDSRRQSRFVEGYCDKVFRPLEDWEQPGRMLAGSGHALENPIGHLMSYIYKSFSLPWPISGHPTGIRQTQLPPPPPRQSESSAPVSFHGFSTQTLAESFSSIHSRSNVASEDGPLSPSVVHTALELST